MVIRTLPRRVRFSRNTVFKVLLLLGSLAAISVQYGLMVRYKPTGSEETSIFEPPSIKNTTTPPKHIIDNKPNSAKTTKWAYAFVIGGIDSTAKAEGAYHGFLYNIAVAAYRLKYVLKSQADIVVFLQLSSHSTSGKYNRDDIQLLESLGVKIKFIPRYVDQKLECFYSLMMEKFRILKLEEYSRVLFLDSDVLPLCSMDYLFELSESPDSDFKENIIIGWNSEPAHGGLFMMKPDLEHWKDVQEILLRREREAIDMEYPHWDPIKGWGHIITAPDYIKTPNVPNAGTNWTWHGSFADQGFLLYYTKYFRKSVSIINDKEVDHWGTFENGTLRLESSSPVALGKGHSCPSAIVGYKDSPYRDFFHFTGFRKPWSGTKNETEQWITRSFYPHEKALKIWFDSLEVVSHNISHVPIQWDQFWNKEGSVGSAPGFVQFSKYLTHRKTFDWKLHRDNDENPIIEERQNQIAKNNNDDDNNKHASTKTTKWAYAFVIGGIDGTAKAEGAYHGFLYSVAVAAYQLKYVLKSQADIVVFLQLSTYSKTGKYNRDDIQLLKSLGVKIKFIPRYRDTKLECFYSLMMEKFRILTLEEYSRVLFMDSDMMPLCNMDYLFELSESPDSDFKENIIIGWNSEPAHGGLFLMKPDLEHWKDVQEILLRREREAIDMKYPHWDPIKGWGHVITAPDYIKTPTVPNAGTNWTWHGSFADQGFLLYYTKYFRKSVSIINDKEVDHWGTSENGTLRLESSSPVALGKDYSCPSVLVNHKDSPYRDFFHFTGAKKPWSLSKNETEDYMKSLFGSHRQALKIWFDSLEVVSHNISHVPIQWDQFWNKEGSVGKTPSFEQFAMYLVSRKLNEWELYRDNDENPVIEERKLHIDKVNENVSHNVTDNDNNNNDKNNAKSAKWAYAFVIGGIGAYTEVKGYHGFLYSVAVAAYQLKYVLKSQADIVVFLQLSTYSKTGKYNRDDIQLLKSLGVKIKFIPRYRDTKLECFYSLMMEKFRILTLEEYSRVLFMDSDMMPLCNMDYLFELSESPDSDFKENIIIGWNAEPAHGGFFLLKPDLEYWKDVQEILLRREREAIDMEYPPWDPVKGWGHVITAPDYIKTPAVPNAGTNWTWHGSYADQGFLLYYTKYFRKSVSIINDKEVDHWGTSENGTLRLESSSPVALGKDYSCPSAMGDSLASPYRDFFHFTGRAKPWSGTKNDTENYIKIKLGRHPKALKIWFDAFEVVSQNISHVPIQWDQFWNKQGSAGKAPSFEQLRWYLVNRQKFDWKLYRDNDEHPTIEGR